MTQTGRNTSWTALESLATRFHLVEMYAFGSRVAEVVFYLREGESAGNESSVSSGSDLDIGVQPERGKTVSFDEKVELAIELEDLFHVSRVDLVVIPEADPFLAAEIIRGELLYCSNPDEQAEHELYVLRRAGDLARYERERIEGILSEECS